MRGSTYRGPGAALAIAVGACALISASSGSAVADSKKVDPSNIADWGTVVQDAGCVQAHSWIARVQGLGGVVNTALFEAHFPTYGSAQEKAGGEDLIDLKIPDPTGITGGVSFGQASALFSESVGNKSPNDDIGHTYSDLECAAYSKAGGGMVDVGLPDLNPLSGLQDVGEQIVKGAEELGGEIAKGAEEVGGEIAKGAEELGGNIEAGAEEAWDAVAGGAEDVGAGIEEGVSSIGSFFGLREVKKMTPAQRIQAAKVIARMQKLSGKSWAELRDGSPFRVHLEGISVSAQSLPGQPVKFHGYFGNGFISSFGNKIVDIPAEWPSNFGADIDAPWGGTLAKAVTNEQVTTNPDGTGTVDGDGNYRYDPKAASGYVNAGHASVLGNLAADVVVGHAAVLNTTPVKGGGGTTPTTKPTDTKPTEEPKPCPTVTVTQTEKAEPAPTVTVTVTSTPDEEATAY